MSILSYKHFTLAERICLEFFLAHDYSMRRIARVLGRSPSTISREIKRNSAAYKPKKNITNKYWYNHWRAQNQYIIRRRNNAAHVAALSPGTAAWLFIIEHLQQYWSPEAICGRWHLEQPNSKKLCVSTIYRYIKAGKFPDITRKKNLRRRGKKKQTRNANYNTIQPDRIIPDWPVEISKRLRIGDWEGDTVYGGIGKGLLVTLVDRKSRYLKMKRISSRNAIETGDAIVSMLGILPVESISLDNGSEFADFNNVEKQLNTLIYFAEPHKPWQRPTNENTNDILRFFFPKGFDFNAITDDDVQLVEDLINSRPRKCLDWHSPAEIFLPSCVALA